MEVAAIVGLVGACMSIARFAGSAAQGIRALKIGHDDVAFHLDLLLVQTGSIEAAATGIGNWLETNPGNLLGMEDGLRASLDACEAVVRALYDMLDVDDQGKIRVGSIRLLSRENQITLFRTELGHQVNALQLQLTILQLPHANERRRELNSPAPSAVINRALESIASLSRENSEIGTTPSDVDEFSGEPAQDLYSEIPSLLTVSIASVSPVRKVRRKAHGLSQPTVENMDLVNTADKLRELPKLPQSRSKISTRDDYLSGSSGVGSLTNDTLKKTSRAHRHRRRENKDAAEKRESTTAASSIVEAALRSASSAVSQGPSMAKGQRSSTVRVKVTPRRDISHVELDDTESMLSKLNDAVSTVLSLSQPSSTTRSTISSSYAPSSSGTSTPRADRAQTPTPATSTAPTPNPQTEEILASLLAFREEFQSLLTTSDTSSSRRFSNSSSTYLRFLQLINSVERLSGRTSTTPINLHSAILLHDTETATRLIRASGALAVNASDAQGQTPLFLAAMQGNLTLVQLLLERGASPMHRDETGLSVVQAVCAAEEPATGAGILAALLKAGAPTEAAAATGSGGGNGGGSNGRSGVSRRKKINVLSAPRLAERPPLHAAAVRGRLEYVDLLVQRGADVNAVENGERGSTALRAVCDGAAGSASNKKAGAVVEQLLRAGADAGAERRDGSTVLEGALKALDVAVRAVLKVVVSGELLISLIFKPVVRYRRVFAVLRRLVEEVDNVRLSPLVRIQVLNSRVYAEMRRMLDGDMMEVRRKVNQEFVAMQIMTEEQLYRSIVRRFTTPAARS